MYLAWHPSTIARAALLATLPFGLTAALSCSGDTVQKKPTPTIEPPDLGTPKPGWGSAPAGVTYYGLQAAVVLSEDGSTVLFFAAHPTVNGEVNDALKCTADLDIRGANVSVQNGLFVFPFRYYEYLFDSTAPTGSLSGTVTGTIAGDRITLQVTYDLGAALCKGQGTTTVQASRLDDPCVPAIPKFASISLNATVGQTMQLQLSATPVFKSLCNKPGATGTISLSLTNQSGGDAALVATDVAITDGAGVAEVRAGSHAGKAEIVAVSPFGATYDANTMVTVTDPCSGVGVTLSAAPQFVGLRPGEKATITVDAALETNTCPSLSPVPLRMSVPGGIVTVATPDVQTSGGQVTFDLVGATPGVATATAKIADPTQRFVGTSATTKIEVNQHPLRALWRLPESIAKTHVDAVALDADTLYLAAGKQLQVVDVNLPLSPSFGPVVSMPHAAYASMAAVGPDVFVGYCDTTSDTLRTVVASGVLAYKAGPAGLSLVGDVKTCGTKSCVSALAIVGNRVVADCDSEPSLEVVDFQANQVASVLAISSVLNRMGDAVSAAEHVYYMESGYVTSATKPSVLHVLALSDAGVISEATKFQLAQICWELSAEGTTLRASCRDGNGNLVLVVIDVSVPTTPVVVTSASSTTKLLSGAVPIVRPNGTFVFAGGGVMASVDTVSTISWFNGETPAALTFGAVESALNYRALAAHGDSLFVQFGATTIDGSLIGIVDLSTPP